MAKLYMFYCILVVVVVIGFSLAHETLIDWGDGSSGGGSGGYYRGYGTGGGGFSGGGHK